MVAVTARLEGRDLGSGVKDVQARLAKGLKLPPGYRIEYGGLYASQQQSFAQLATVLALAVLLVSTLLSSSSARFASRSRCSSRRFCRCSASCSACS